MASVCTRIGPDPFSAAVDKGYAGRATASARGGAIEQVRRENGAAVTLVSRTARAVLSRREKACKPLTPGWVFRRCCPSISVCGF